MPLPTHFRDSDEQMVPYDGSPVTWRISAYAFVIENDSLLLIKNSDEKLYDIPGGGIEIGESILEGLAREGIEEAGATLEIGHLVTTVQNFFYHRNEGRFYQSLLLFYRATRTGELGKATDPRTTMAKFVPFSELDNYPLFSPVKIAMQHLPEFSDHAITESERGL